jgi:hypothetical protein
MLEICNTHRILLKRPNDLPILWELERPRLHRLRVEELKNVIERFRVLFHFYDGKLAIDGVARRGETPRFGRGQEEP